MANSLVRHTQSPDKASGNNTRNYRCQHVKKLADARRGRNWTRAMENWAKPRTRHVLVHGPLHGPVNGLNGYTWKSGRRPSWTELDARHGKL